MSYVLSASQRLVRESFNIRCIERIQSSLSVLHVEGVTTMKRRIIILLSIIIISTVGIVIGASSNNRENVVGASPERINATPQTPAGEIDGAVNPELIPDHVAYSLLFRLISSRETEEEQRQIKAYIRGIGLGESGNRDGTDADVLIAMAEGFRQQVNVFDAEANDIVERHHPEHTIAYEESRRLDQMRNQKVLFTDDIIARLPHRLSPEGWAALQRHIERMKRKTKMSVGDESGEVAAIRRRLFAPAMVTGFSAAGSLVNYVPVASRGGRAGHRFRRASLVNYVPVASQSTQPPESSFYSDSWIDSSGPGYLVGCGITEIGYGDMDTPGQRLHSADVDVTITSPSGRTQTRTSRGSWYACATPTLLFDPNDTGDYVVRSRHYSSCPVTDFGTTSLRKVLVRSAYVRDVVIGYVATCTSTCTRPRGYTPVGVSARFIQCFQLRDQGGDGLATM